MRVYLAEHDGDLVAATTFIRVGTHAWYSYGASTTAKREVRGSNAIQWRMMRDARDAGADIYDLRGINRDRHTPQANTSWKAVIHASTALNEEPGRPDSDRHTSQGQYLVEGGHSRLNGAEQRAGPAR